MQAMKPSSTSTPSGPSKPSIRSVKPSTRPVEHGGVDRAAGRTVSGPYGEVVRLSEFWERMRDHFGPGYAESVARDHVLAELNGRTADQALAAGIDAKRVWRAVCDDFEVPRSKR
jgi:Protein of unknown function (DUF3046)